MGRSACCWWGHFETFSQAQLKDNSYSPIKFVKLESDGGNVPVNSFPPNTLIKLLKNVVRISIQQQRTNTAELSFYWSIQELFRRLGYSWVNYWETY